MLRLVGSEMAKEVSDLVLLDDNFASIILGIEEGRLLFANLRKSLAYTLSSNIPELAPFLAYLVLGLPLPLSTILILLIDMTTDLWPAIAIAYEPPEVTLMRRPPRKHERLVTPNLMIFGYFQVGVIQCLSGFFAYLVVMGDYGFPPWSLIGTGYVWSSESVMVDARNASYRELVLAKAQSAYFAAIIIVQWVDLIVSKTRLASLFRHNFNNQWLNIGLLLETVLAVLVIYVPFLNPIFGTSPLEFRHLLPALPFALILFAYDELRKLALRADPRGFVARVTMW